MKILVVAAHPDDEVLGCGGTVAGYVRKGFEAYLLHMTEGVKGRYSKDLWNSPEVRNEIMNLKKETEKAAKIIGFRKIFNCSFDDQYLDNYPFVEIVKCVERIIKSVNPSIIFTHSIEDLNLDHVVTARAVITAARPFTGVREIYSFEIPSSTDWNPAGNFSPNVFFDITPFMDVKIKALQAYSSEMRKFSHPRSVEGIRSLARIRGMQSSFEYAEGFTLVKFLKNLDNS